jgi:hypothetical protein
VTAIAKPSAGVSRHRADYEPTARQKAEQAAARAGALIGRWFEARTPDRVDLERARRALDEAIELVGG